MTMSLLKNEGIIHHGLDQGEPKEENERLRRLYRTNILDTPPEQEFENIVELCSEICDTPIALISFIDRDRQWNKAKVGMDVKEFPRELSFCTHCIESDEEVYEIQDARDHTLFSENPFVKEVSPITDLTLIEAYGNPPRVRAFESGLLTSEG